MRKTNVAFATRIISTVLLTAVLGLFAIVSLAAKVPMQWVLATQNTDRTALTNLSATKLEWGSCINGAFGTTQSSVTYPVPAVAGPIYPSGLTTVCIRAYSLTADGQISDPTNTLVLTLSSPLGKPVTLGQPITL